MITLQGLGASFEGFPGGIVDPKKQILYSVHPFLSTGSPSETNWFNRFGLFSRYHPFVLTAWGAHTRDPWCEESPMGPLKAFSLNIKVVGT